MSNQNRLEKDVQRLQEKLQRVEQMNSTRNENDVKSRLYEELLHRITEISQRQNQMQYDLSAVKESQGGNSVAHNYAQSVIQRLVPSSSSSPSSNLNQQQFFEFSYDFSHHHGGKSLTNSSVGAGNSSSYLGESHTALYGGGGGGDTPSLHNIQHQSGSSKDLTSSRIEDTDSTPSSSNLFYDQSPIPTPTSIETPTLMKKQGHHERSMNCIEPFSSFW